MTKTEKAYKTIYSLVCCLPLCTRSKGENAMIIARVDNIQDISPHMRRIVFSSDDFTQSYQGKESAHLKLLFPKEGEIKLHVAQILCNKLLADYLHKEFSRVVRDSVFIDLSIFMI